MKKILLIILFIFPFSLFADEKRVTEEMLLGDWECVFTIYYSKWKNGAFQDYGEPQIKKVKHRFLKKNGVFFYIRGEGNVHEDFGLNDFYDKQEIRSSVNSLQTRSIEYVSDDKFIIRHYFESYFRKDIYTEKEKELYNSRSKIEKSCERIKG